MYLCTLKLIDLILNAYTWRNSLFAFSINTYDKTRTRFMRKQNKQTNKRTSDKLTKDNLKRKLKKTLTNKLTSLK